MLKFLILSLLISGCAYGSEAPDVEVTEVISAPPQRVNPIPSPVNEEPESIHGECVSRMVWLNNCSMTVTKCEDGFYDVDTKCYPTGYQMPWKNLPDPPPGDKR